MPSVARTGAGVLMLLAIASCSAPATRAEGDAGPPAAGGLSASSGPKVPLKTDALDAEACALAALPVETKEQRAAVGLRAHDIGQRYSGTRGPRSDIPFLLVSMTTLAHVPKGDTFFGTASAQPTLKNGFVLPNTLEEALSALSVECAADD